MKKCFIVCPIGNDGSDTRKRSDKLLKHVIAPVCNECGFDEPIRVDSLNSSDSITETILKHLTESDLVIADLTEHNPNAFYEIGYRTALNKPIIHLKDKSDSIPFDVYAIRTFDYDLTDLDSVDELKERLIQTINSISFTDSTSSVNEDSSKTFNSQILQELFVIQDNIKDLDSKISKSSTDTSVISVLADKIANNNKTSPEEKFLEQLIPVMMEDPQKLNSLIEFSNKINKNSK
ncbi:nucleoside 2-deoxyribosyltransferase [Clostridium pasteurianum]|uniref:Nucleoside 2-deoxyribosyltransferase n=1 Tax=Clostridium pasteurianum BC1 TaxID=86416 RepID=R4JZ95_CLOPA|nr:nucleoside 2-deoxyribosyltransferase [Clostridium pasteurianum]AGK95623.1 Nucleoside 2-deoxyribosyltransferase [Clostridium pasteurianum BC1]